MHPHNPTGSTLQVEEMQAIARMGQRVGALVVNAEAFCRHLALERRIFLLPGSVFGPAYENFIRVGLGGDIHQFQEGMSIMLDELLRWRGR